MPAKPGLFQESPPALFNQGLYEISSTQKHRLGTVRRLDDGRVFYYARAGAANLAAGVLCQSEVPGSNYDELVVATAPAVGDTSIVLTNDSSAITANMFKDGYAVGNKGNSVGHVYKIRGNTAAAGGATVTIYLYDSIRAAGASGDEYTLVKNPFDSVIIHPSPPTATLVGVPPVAVTATYYFWIQTAGYASVLTQGTVTAGKLVTGSATVDGAVAALALSVGTPDTGADQLIVGVSQEVAVDTEYSVIDLMIKF